MARTRKQRRRQNARSRDGKVRSIKIKRAAGIPAASNVNFILRQSGLPVFRGTRWL